MHPPTAQQVQMDMKDRLPAVASLIQHHAVPIPCQTSLPRHLPRDRHQMPDHTFVGDVHIQRPGDVIAWYHQDMCRRLGIDIHKCDRVFIFIHNLSRLLACDNLAEQAPHRSYPPSLFMHSRANLGAHAALSDFGQTYGFDPVGQNARRGHFNPDVIVGQAGVEIAAL